MTRYVFIPNELAGRSLTAPSDSFQGVAGRFTRRTMRLDASGRETIAYYQRRYVIERVIGTSIWRAVALWRFDP